MGTDRFPDDEQQQLKGGRFRPLGSRASFQWRISRRGFLGASVAVPAALALDATARTARPLDDPYDVRFVEDAQGMSVITAQDELVEDARFCAVVTVTKVWRLHRLAFGPSTTFALRTLEAGSEKGYELRIEGLRFGSLEGRSHWIVFQREGNKGHDWRVRMRTNLWSDIRGEITSEDILLSKLLAPSSDSKPPSWFRFKRTTIVTNRALESALDSHVRASGPMQLTLDADCAWNFKPLRSASLAIAPYGLHLTDLTLAWCEPALTHKEGPPGLPDQLEALATIDEAIELSLIQQQEKGEDGNKNIPNDPGCCKDNTKPKKRKPQALQSGAGAVAQPVFCASGLTQPGDTKILYRGESPFSVSLVHSNGKGPNAPATLSYIYLRRNWNVQVSQGSASPAGTAEIKSNLGQWSLTTNLGRQRSFGPLAVEDGSIRVQRTVEKGSNGFQDEFFGFASSASSASSPSANRTRGNISTTPIGELQIGSWAEEDRSAASNRTILQAHYSSVQDALGQPGNLQRFSAPFLLYQCPLSLGGSDFSQFTFNSAAVVALWCPQNNVQDTLKRAQSYLWLGANQALHDRPAARLDLSRARLAVSRSHDLLETTFLFADLYLEVRVNKVQIVPAAATYRVLERRPPVGNPLHPSSSDLIGEQADILDTRPVLVVEFPPQHVFEESLFKPGGSDLPEVTLMEAGSPIMQFTGTLPNGDKKTFPTDPAQLVRYLEQYNVDDRKSVRKQYAAMKYAQEKNGLFKALYDKLIQPKYHEGFCKEIADQFVYIGPYGMDPDVRAQARAVMLELQEEPLKTYCKTLLSQAADVADGLNNKDLGPDNDPSLRAKLRRMGRVIWRRMFGGSPVAATGPADAILHENVICSVLPDYAFFRDYYREQMTRKWMIPAQENSQKASNPNDGTPEQLEFFSENNRGWATDDLKGLMQQRQEEIRDSYAQVLAGTTKIHAIMRARLANPSRLAFRLNLEPERTLRFNLESLLNWQQHELAVTPRARAVTAFDQAGRVRLAADQKAPAQTEDALDAEIPELTGKQQAADEKKDPAGLQGAVEDVSMLRLLGFRFGQFVTAQERLSDVEASLRRPPEPLETAIEIPARLILSPSQTAQWKIPWTPIANGPFPAPPTRKSSTSPGGLLPLWSVELITQPVDPSVRVVHSPDLHPGFVRRNLERAASKAANTKRDPVLITVAAAAAPPRGPRAPWTLGMEDGDPSATKLKDLAKQIGVTDEKVLEMNSGDACAAAEAPAIDPTLPPLIRYLRWRKVATQNYGDSALFRSSLDAYDRHEIVLLSSAYGLPVSGKRDEKGQLLPLATSSQAEPPPLLQPIDLELGSALYRPRSLRLQELRLSALGGTFRHDTDFVPPTAANHIVYGALYDSLSVERWQHWVVLGRDVFAEVVYKGFLFPIGHRASLVKQTERVFLRATLDGSIRAYLRQRLFIRVGRPDKTFPALGQPNLGRQFPARLVHILTTVTPDLVDPSQDNDQNTDKSVKSGPPLCQTPASPGGRLLVDMPGLVFWPRTARAPGSEIRFQALLDGSFVKLPLIFVDNTATQNADVLEALTGYYNNLCSPDQDPRSLGPVRPAEHLRTLDFAEQALRYCDEVKPGSASHRTLFWTLKASGGMKQRMQPGPDSPNWEGDNTRFENPVLDGADQPSFYPALETARIHLDQIERMTAQETVIGLANFDNHYIAYGFPPATDPNSKQETKYPQNQAAQDASKQASATTPVTTTRAQDNQLEIYLKIANDVSFSMGAAGDRSGGVYRPEGDVVALSRTRGPIGGSAEVRQKPTVVTAYPRDDNSKTYAAYFDRKPSSQTQPSPLDTKLLGIVSLKDVVQAMKSLRRASEGLPQLREVLNYGAAGASSAEETLRSDIIRPLTMAFAELETQWNHFDQELRQAIEQKSVTISMADIFPEANKAKNDFGAALGRVASLNGVEFYASLADVYETGRRLADALQQTSLHTVERSFLAVANAIPDFLKKHTFDLDQLANTLTGKMLGIVGNLTDFSNNLSLLILSDPRTVARFFPILGGMDQNTFTSLQNNKTVFDEYLKRAAQTESKECAEQFIDKLVEKIPNIDPVAKTWRETTLPLFVMASELSRIYKSNDLKAWAAAGTKMMEELGPVPKGWKPDDFGKLLSKLAADLTSLQEKIADLSTETMKEDFIPRPDRIEVPSKWQQPSKYYVSTTLERTLYDFAKSASTVFPRAHNEGSKFLVSAANGALSATQQLHRGCDELQSKIYLKALIAELQSNDAVMRIDPSLIKRIFDQFASLMMSVEHALDAVLPKALPALAELDARDREEIAKALRATVSQAVETQQQALDLAAEWVGAWKGLTSLDGETAAKALDDTVQVSRQSLKAATQAVNKCKEWADWLGSDRMAIQPLQPGFLPSLATQAETRLIEWWSATLSSKTAVAAQASRVGVQILQILEGQYQQLLDVREKVVLGATSSAPDSISAQLVPGLYIRPERSHVYNPPNFSPDDRLNQDNDQLHWDHESLQTLSKKQPPETLLDDSDCFQFLRYFLNSWVQGTDTPSRIIQQMQNSLSLEIARSRLLSIVDFSRLREEIDAAIKNLIPHSSELTYAFDLALEEKAARDASLGFFSPQQGCRLTIVSKTKVDFLKGTAEFRSLGELGPFDIELLGTIAKALTLKFDGVRFESTGGPVHCDVKFRSVVIGPMLKFLEQLQKFLSPKKGSGFYLVPLSGSLGIEAGYGLNLGTISFGNISFSNVSLNAAARLPFDGHEATFVASLSRRDAPFTISVAPYGGAGFFLIEASAKGVTAFEASFEYGGAAAFQYGPLSGYGRIMVGVYIRVGAGGKIAATFYAGGSASIWIFSFGASLYVTAESKSGENTIVGTATFTFSFSIGIADYDFKVSVRKELQWSGGSGGSSNGSQQGWLHEQSAPVRLAPTSHTEQALFRADSWCQSEHWGRHREHFDPSLAVDVEEFA